jgi:hypothetical protein
MKKQRLCRIGGGAHGYIFYINNDQLMAWARNDRIRWYISQGDPDTRDDNLRKDMRYFIEAINAWPIMAEYNLGLFQDDIDQLYSDFMEMINEEVELGSLGIIESLHV